MEEEKKLRTLEGLGYCGAVMIVASVLGDDRVLRFFHLCGLALGLIVVVRMLTVNVLAQKRVRGFKASPREPEPSRDRGDEVTR